MNTVDLERKKSCFFAHSVFQVAKGMNKAVSPTGSALALYTPKRRFMF